MANVLYQYCAAISLTARDAMRAFAYPAVLNAADLLLATCTSSSLLKRTNPACSLRRCSSACSLVALCTALNSPLNFTYQRPLAERSTLSFLMDDSVIFSVFSFNAQLCSKVCNLGFFCLYFCVAFGFLRQTQQGGTGHGACERVVVP